MPDLDSFTTFFAENTFGIIIGALGVFFMLAAFVKGIRNRRERQFRESAASAVANGGTPDAPVHIGNPFQAIPPPTPAEPAPSAAPAPVAAAVPAPAPAAPAPAPTATPAPAPASAAPSDEDKYVWE